MSLFTAAASPSPPFLFSVSRNDSDSDSDTVPNLTEAEAAAAEAASTAAAEEDDDENRCLNKSSFMDVLRGAAMVQGELIRYFPTTKDIISGRAADYLLLLCCKKEAVSYHTTYVELLLDCVWLDSCECGDDCVVSCDVVVRGVSRPRDAPFSGRIGVWSSQKIIMNNDIRYEHEPFLPTIVHST